MKEEFVSLPERDPGEHWYDDIKFPESISKKGRKITPDMDRLAEKHFLAYLSAECDTVSDKEAKLKKASVYVEGLLSIGGPSTDALKKAIGQEKTAELFRNYLFKTV